MEPIDPRIPGAEYCAAWNRATGGRPVDSIRRNAGHAARGPLDDFDPLSAAFWTVVGVAVPCGGIVGPERQFRGKPSGVRTRIPVCLATACAIHLGGTIAGPGSAPTRVPGQLATGIGFLGVGFMFSHEGTVTGATTAAIISILAAIGAMVGPEREEGRKGPVGGDGRAIARRRGPGDPREGARARRTQTRRGPGWT